MKRLLYALIVAALIPVCATAQNTNKKMKEITAIELYNTLRKGGEDALEKYRMKTMLISGVAVKVGPDVYGLPSVEVSEVEGGSCRALCVLPFSDYLKLRKVKKKDTVVMQGEVRGYTGEYDLVVVKQCKIVSVNGEKL